ncbi:MAG: putative selenate reductase subunit YgfK [Oscillospiraceae bacterium]|nr:putative selenate reductase subunit YgfK [Oscillospiraceae bacterium]
MSRIMRPIPFENLTAGAEAEYTRFGSIFGVKKLFKAPDKSLPLFGGQPETPVGPAAGPHTQLAQNIISAYAAGARFFELKTVQEKDGEELAALIPRPCITAADEGYNCEWSTELTVLQAAEEYIKAWCALWYLSQKTGLGRPDGFVFNMSVGYDLAGIKGEKTDSFIEDLKDATGTGIFDECKNILKNRFKEDPARVDSINPRICAGVTLSTLHGCPPGEIERIVTYLLEEKRLHTFVKLNPTLLGYETVRERLDVLGYDGIKFGREHFDGDLHYSDALPMFRRLKKTASSLGLEFGLKLSNTFPVSAGSGELPADEMYMSGRALFPLTAEMAKRLASDLGPETRLSFSGGADAYNIKALFNAGIRPVTMATTLLKPGGYDRLYQIAEIARKCRYEEFTGTDVKAIGKLADGCIKDPYYRKALKSAPERKNGKKIPLFDCFTAPCRGGCPIGQDIPAYLRAASEKDFSQALRIITRQNPLPFITGTICPQRCGDRCVRNYYDEPVHIRAAKLMCAEKAADALFAEKTALSPEGDKTAVVGGGPAGLAAAYFSARAGLRVTLFEKNAKPGGLVREVIPEFRIPCDRIDKDTELIISAGAEIRCGEEITDIKKLMSEGCKNVILAVGAPVRSPLKLEGGDCIPAVDFLIAVKNGGASPYAAESIAVVGGGNTAMDAARAAKRLPGVKNVYIIYRRDRRNMPADEEELTAALEEGVEFKERLLPAALRNGSLFCRRTVLVKEEGLGRLVPVLTDETEEIPADLVISATGEHVDSEFYIRNGIKTDDLGFAAVDPETLESSVPRVYVAGDGRKGPSSVVEAIADAAKAVAAISGISCGGAGEMPVASDERSVFEKRALICTDPLERRRPEQCLDCAAVCEICVEVCPNRANISVPVGSKKQIVHIDDLCNECGNCAVFCPYSGRPYEEKLTLFGSEAEFSKSKNPGFYSDNGKLTIRPGDGNSQGSSQPETEAETVIKALEKNYPNIFR